MFQAAQPFNFLKLVACETLAFALMDLGKRAEAVTIYRATLEAKRAMLPDDHEELATTLSNLVGALAHFPFKPCHGQPCHGPPHYGEIAGVGVCRLTVSNQSTVGSLPYYVWLSRNVSTGAHVFTCRFPALVCGWPVCAILTALGRFVPSGHCGCEIVQSLRTCMH
jgi:hypothetical protein